MKSLFRPVQWGPLVEKHCPTLTWHRTHSPCCPPGVAACQGIHHVTIFTRHTHLMTGPSRLKTLVMFLHPDLLMSSTLLSEHPLRVMISSFLHLIILRQIKVYLFQALVTLYTSGCCAPMEIEISFTVMMVSNQRMRHLWTDHTGVGTDWKFQTKN